MKASIDISLYPLADDYIPAIQEFIDKVQEYPEITVIRNDLSTQLFGDFDQIMELLKTEVKFSWEKYGKGIFVVKLLKDDLQGLAGD